MQVLMDLPLVTSSLYGAPASPFLSYRHVLLPHLHPLLPDGSVHLTDSFFLLSSLPRYIFLTSSNSSSSSLIVQVGDVTSLSPSPSPSPSSSSSRHTLISPPSNFEHVYHMTSASAGAFLQKDVSSCSSSQQSLLQPSSSSSPSTSSLGRVGQFLSISLAASPLLPLLFHSGLQWSVSFSD